MNNIFSLPILAITLLILIANHAALSQPDSQWPVKNTPFFQGFEQKVSGTELDFLPGLTNGQVALLARAKDGENMLEFKTSIVPLNFESANASFVWSASSSKSLTNNPGKFDFYFNEEKLFTFQNHADSSTTDWSLENRGAELHFVTTEFAKGTEDVFGYMFLNVPKSMIKMGLRQSIKIVGQPQQSIDWIMHFGVPVISKQEVLAEPAIAKTNKGPKQRIRVALYHAGAPAIATFKIDGKIDRIEKLKPGKRIFYLFVDPVKEEKRVTLEISIAGYSKTNHEVKLIPVREYEVYFLAHSHVDIGFTHTQDDVEKLQWRNFDLGIDLAEKTQDYPDGAQFKWNAEITWAIEGYLNQSSTEQKERFLSAVRKGWIGLDALIGSQLTGLQREEEMMNNQRFAIELSDKYGFDVNSAMISDVPGYSWGSVESLAKSGVKYFSSGPNHMPHLPHGGYQVGYTMETWGDVPFYWTSASGKEKVLFWMTSHGYSWFHSWSVDILSKAGGDPILRHLSELEDQGYPYDLVQLRYTVGNDNGPPDETMPDFIKEWNERYEWPKMRIATNKEMMVEFEKRYADEIPVHNGDFTPYWEDGAASSALETGMNRKSADRLTQAETLWALAKPKTAFPQEQFDDAWRNILLYSEHTWGANISKSQPDSEFTKSLWDVKQGFAVDAQRQSESLIEAAIPTTSMEAVEAIQLINTTSWLRSELVTIPSDWNLKGTKITDENGKTVASQLLTTGELVFVAADIPALGAKKYFIKKGKAKLDATDRPSENSLSNDLVSVSINEDNGDISSIIFNGKQLVNVDDSLGFNAYWYGGLIKSNLSKQTGSSVVMVESGAVLKRIQISSDAHGSKKLIREITLVSGMEEVFIKNEVDKTRITEDENVRFTFPFEISEGQVSIDIPWATIEPEKDQLKGANKNFYSVQRWVDISNENSGVTIAPIEAPLLEIGDMNGQKWMTDMEIRPWIKKYEPSNTLISWVMNNAWFVNYKAFQEGKIPFQYVIRPHEKFDVFETKKWGMALTQPLIVRPIGKNDKIFSSPIQIESFENVLITSLKKSRDGKGFVVRLFNPTNEQGLANFSFAQEKDIFECGPKDIKGSQIDSPISLDPWEVKTIWIE